MTARSHAEDAPEVLRRPLQSQASHIRARSSGFPFERYVARLFDAMGYATQVGIVLPGKCVTHDRDRVGEQVEECLKVP